MARRDSAERSADDRIRRSRLWSAGRGDGRDRCLLFTERHGRERLGGGLCWREWIDHSRSHWWGAPKKGREGDETPAWDVFSAFPFICFARDRGNRGSWPGTG